MSPWIRGVAASATGAVRNDNEDAAFLAVAGEMALAVVADGTGGRSSGRAAADRTIASARATFARRFLLLAEAWWHGEHDAPLPTGEHARTSAHVRHLLATRHAETPGDVAVLERGLGELVRRAMIDANRAVHEQATRDPHHRGHGASVVIAMFAPGGCAIAHVGDARAYRLRAGALTQLTEDHSLLNAILKERTMTEDELARFEHRNVIVRAVGTSASVEVDVDLHAVTPSDTLLVCSDGLYETLGEERLREVLGLHGAEAATRLVDEAKRTSRDNVTAITVAC